MRKFACIIVYLCLLITRAWAGDPPPAAHDLRDSVDLQLHTVKTTQTLFAGHPGITYLEVINNSSDSLHLTLSTQGPDFLTVNSSVNSALLPPKNSFVFAEQLSVADRTYPGTSLVLFQVGIAYAKNGQPAQTAKVITQEVGMGVLGESGIMTILGLNVFAIPFFLVLPGFLFLVIWASFLPQAYTTQKTLLAATADKKDPFFWVAAITLSLLLSSLYAVATRHSVWISYGLLDVFYLWMGSILLGILLLFALHLNLYFRTRREASKDFTLRDTPLIVLTRLNKRKADFFLPQGEAADTTGLIFRLGTNKSPAADAPVFWYSYGILVKKALTSGSKEEGIYSGLVESLRNLDNHRSAGDLTTLIRQLKHAELVKAVTIEFEKEPGIISPLSGNFTITQQHKNIVHT